MNLKWQVGSVPTGRYRSFQRRTWPKAYLDGKIVAAITCDDEYYPPSVREGNHAPLNVFIYDYSQGSIERKMRKLVKTFATLQEAKITTKSFFERYPQILPPADVK